MQHKAQKCQNAEPLIVGGILVRVNVHQEYYNKKYPKEIQNKYIKHVKN